MRMECWMGLPYWGQRKRWGQAGGLEVKKRKQGRIRCSLPSLFIHNDLTPTGGRRSEPLWEAVPVTWPVVLPHPGHCDNHIAPYSFQVRNWLKCHPHFLQCLPHRTAFEFTQAVFSRLRLFIVAMMFQTSTQKLKVHRRKLNQER